MMRNINVRYKAEYHSYRTFWIILGIVGAILTFSNYSLVIALGGGLLFLSIEQVWWWTLILRGKPTRIWFPPLIADSVEPEETGVNPVLS